MHGFTWTSGLSTIRRVLNVGARWLFLTSSCGCYIHDTRISSLSTVFGYKRGGGWVRLWKLFVILRVFCTWQFPRIGTYTLCMCPTRTVHATGTHTVCLILYITSLKSRVVPCNTRNLSVRAILPSVNWKIEIQTFTVCTQYLISLLSSLPACTTNKLKRITHLGEKVYNGITSCYFERFGSSIFWNDRMCNLSSMISAHTCTQLNMHFRKLPLTVSVSHHQEKTLSGCEYVIKFKSGTSITRTIILD